MNKCLLCDYYAGAAVEENESSAREYNPEQFDRYLIDAGCVGFVDPPMKLGEERNGEPVYSPVYFNLRKASATVGLLKQTAGWLNDFCDYCEIEGDYFLGVPYGATKVCIAANLIYRSNKTKVPMSRKTPKTHGDPDSLNYVTAVEKGDRPIVVEDVKTTAESLIRELKKTLAVGAEPVAVTLLNRLEKRDDGKNAADIVRAMGVPYYYMTDAARILPPAFQQLSPEQQDFFGPRVETYYEKYGVIKITANNLKRTVF